MCGFSVTSTLDWPVPSLEALYHRWCFSVPSGFTFKNSTVPPDRRILIPTNLASLSVRTNSILEKPFFGVTSKRYLYPYSNASRFRRLSAKISWRSIPSQKLLSAPYLRIRAIWFTEFEVIGRCGTSLGSCFHQTSYPSSGSLYALDSGAELPDSTRGESADCKIL